MCVLHVSGKRITSYGFLLLVIVLVGFFFRVYRLGAQSIWYDEAWSVWMSQMSVPEMLRSTAALDIHPPLYFFILHYWVILFGTSELAARFLSALFGVLAIPLIFVVGRQLFGKEVGLIAALILALSQFNIWWSQEARGYSLMVFLTLLSMYFFLRWQQRNTLASSAGYVLSTTLVVYTHFYGLFVVLAQNIYVMVLVLLLARHTFQLKRWVMLQAIVVALFAPWIPVLIHRASSLQGGGYWLLSPTTFDLMVTFVKYASGSPIFELSASTVLLSIIFILLSILSLFRYMKQTGLFDWRTPLKAVTSYSWNVRVVNVTSVLFLVVWLFALIVIPFTISRFTQPVYYYKYTIPASVAFYMLVAAGIQNINRKYTRLAVIAVIVLLSTASLPPYYALNRTGEAREAVGFIDAYAKSGDVVLVFPDKELIFDYYNNRTDIAVKQIRSWGSAQAQLDNTNVINQTIYSDVKGHDRVWFFAFPTSETAQANYILDLLNTSYAQRGVKNYYGYKVYLYQKRA